MSVRRAICALASLLLPLAAGHDLPAQEGPRSERQVAGAGPAPEPAAPTTRLVYQLPPRELAALVARATGRTPDSVAADTVAVLQRRLAGSAQVHALGGTTFEVACGGDPAAVASVRARVERRGRLELRVVADERSGAAGGPLYDLQQERQRLQAWLDDGGREAVRADWRAIDRFNDDLEHGPVAKMPRADGKGAASALRWCPHLVRTRADNAAQWNHPYALDDQELGGVQPLAPASLAIFDPKADWNQGLVPRSIAAAAGPAARPFLLEFVAVNLAEEHFTDAQFDPSKIRVGTDAGTSVVDYQLQPQWCALYGNWSQKYIHRHFAILVDGVVQAAPWFAGRIPGHGRIAGLDSVAEAETLAACLRGGELDLVPVLLRQEPIAPPK